MSELLTMKSASRPHSRPAAHSRVAWSERVTRNTPLVLLLLAVAMLITRVPLLFHQPLWADELFSLAVGTGHSLEHPAAVADPAKGDYAEPAGVMPASHFSAYLRHDEPAAGIGRVIRAVLLSDTSPPLYYLLVYGWTRVAGNSDASLRGLSLLFSFACLPLLWSIGRRLGGQRAALFACVLFAFSPNSIYFSTEGRMYALTWLLALTLAWLTLRAHERGWQPRTLAAWCLVASVALLTHYFLLFVVVACGIWMALQGWVMPRLSTRRPGDAKASDRLPLWALPVMALAVGALVSPWFVNLPASLRAWRVTAGWLDKPWEDLSALKAPFRMAWTYFSLLGPWFGPMRLERLAYLVIAAAVALGAWRLRGRLLAPRWRLLWLWVAASCFGPLVFDFLQGTRTGSVYRYALPGMPAAFLLVGTLLGHRRVPRVAGIALLALFVLMTVPATRRILITKYRVNSGDYKRLAARIEADRQAGDVVIMQSIPSGVLGCARYLPPDMPMISWVARLEQRRMPDDLERLIAGRRRVVFVEAHNLGEPLAAKEWLDAHAVPEGPVTLIGGASMWRYRPSGGETFGD